MEVKAYKAKKKKERNQSIRLGVPGGFWEWNIQTGWSPTKTLCYCGLYAGKWKQTSH